MKALITFLALSAICHSMTQLNNHKITVKAELPASVLPNNSMQKKSLAKLDKLANNDNKSQIELENEERLKARNAKEEIREFSRNERMNRVVETE